MAIFGGSYMDDMLPPSGADNSGDDILWGGMGDDTLQGGAGNDRLIGGPGGDTMNGGPGMDTASYADSPVGVHVDMSTSFVDRDMREPIRGGDAEGDALSSIEIIWGSDFADVIKGTHAHNHLFGNGGSDTLYGMRGNDLLRGGGDDDQLLGGDGMDTLYGDMGVDDLQGEMGNDMLFGGMDDDILDGGMGNDMLEGGPGADDLMGGDGMDTAAYTMSSEAVTVDLRYPSSTPGVKAPMGGDAVGDTIGMDVENLRGSMYGDTLIGDEPHADYMPKDDKETTDVDESKLYSGMNTLYGNMGDDMLKGMGGDDTLYGGKGMDTLYGGGGNDTLRGEMGDDALKGEDGDDTLVGGPGADKLFGGRFIAEDMKPGDDTSMKDTADYSMSPEGVTVSLIAANHDDDRRTPDNIMGKGGDAEGDVLMDIEYLTGSSHKDMLEGDGEANLLKGGGGDDWDSETIRGKDGGLFGGGGNDTLEGGSGNDLLKGEEGDDTLKGGSGNDRLDGGAGGTRTAAENNPDTADDESTDRDLDTFNEVLEGGGGDDTLIGGAGVEKLDGGNGVDTADYTGVTDPVVITLDSDGDADQLTATDGDVTTDSDMLISIENLTGGSGADVLTGNNRANVLNGGTGADTLTGEGGADVFVFGKEAVTGAATDAADSALDTVEDFSKSQGDQIDLTALQLSNSQLLAVIEAANSAAGEVTGSNGRLEITLELSEHGARDVEITMTERFAELDADDFLI